MNKSIARSLKTELRVFCKLVPGRGGLEDKKKNWAQEVYGLGIGIGQGTVTS